MNSLNIKTPIVTPGTSLLIPGKQQGSIYEEEAQAFFARMTSEPDETRKGLISTPAEIKLIDGSLSENPDHAEIIYLKP